MWKEIRTEFNLESDTYFFSMQLANALPCSWKRSILGDKGNSSNLCVYNSQSPC